MSLKNDALYLAVNVRFILDFFGSVQLGFRFGLTFFESLTSLDSLLAFPPPNHDLRDSLSQIYVMDCVVSLSKFV